MVSQIHTQNRLISSLAEVYKNTKMVHFINIESNKRSKMHYLQRQKNDDVNSGNYP